MITLVDNLIIKNDLSVDNSKTKNDTTNLQLNRLG